jgi:putative ABC transport system ATP-binding protein
MLTSASRRFKQTILMITHNNNLTASVDRVFRVSDGILADLGGTTNETLS